MWATDEGFNYESLPKHTTHQLWFPLGFRGGIYTTTLLGD